MLLLSQSGAYSKKLPKERDQKHKQPHRPQKDEQSANVSAFIVMGDLSANMSDLNSAWYLDSGASKHMTFDRECFQNFAESGNEYVSLGDGAPCEIKGQLCTSN